MTQGKRHGARGYTTDKRTKEQQRCAGFIYQVGRRASGVGVGAALAMRKARTSAAKKHPSSMLYGM